MIRRLVRQAESSDIQQEWSQIKKEYFWNSAGSARKINEDRHDDECIGTGQEKNEGRIKLLKTNSRQNRDLYKQIKKDA